MLACLSHNNSFSCWFSSGLFSAAVATGSLAGDAGKCMLSCPCSSHSTAKSNYSDHLIQSMRVFMLCCPLDHLVCEKSLCCCFFSSSFCICFCDDVEKGFNFISLPLLQSNRWKRSAGVAGEMRSRAQPFQDCLLSCRLQCQSYSRSHFCVSRVLPRFPLILLLLFLGIVWLVASPVS